MENILRFLFCSLFVMFCSYTSECQSASVLERRFLIPPPFGPNDILTEDIPNGGPPLDSTSSEVLLDLSESKPRITTFTKLPDLERYNIQETAAALATFLNQPRPFHQASKSLRNRNAWGTVLGEQHERPYGEVLESKSDNLWKLFPKYAQKLDEAGPQKTQEEQDSKEFLQTIKRGSACLMSCITRGVLHPAQCHSLC